MLLRSSGLLFLSFLLTAVYSQSTDDGGGVLVLTGQNVSPTAISASSATDDASSSLASFASMAASNTSSAVSSSTTNDPLIVITGRPRTTSTLPTHMVNMTGTPTETSAVPTNTQPCNLHPEFCNRRYGNITQVCSHNSPFVQRQNVAANQDFPVLTQLNDGIRMLQMQVHYVNQSLWLCHSSCDLLNSGSFLDFLKTVAGWVRTHPYDVLTLLIGNAGYIGVNNFTGPLEDSGLKPYIYTPPKNPLPPSEWPSFGNMILNSQRVVVFMDYQANMTAIPWILDEFTYMWETPFDPTDRNFPCDIQRPPNLQESDAKTHMYIANHNLNTNITLLGNTIQVPTVPLLNETNAVEGFGSLGLAAETCKARWDHPPTWLNVDFYNVGNGSVFEVAAKMNNVTYEGECCGTTGAGIRRYGGSLWLAGLVASAVAVFLL